MVKFFNDFMGLAIQKGYTDRTHRVGRRKQDGDGRAMIVKFYCYKTKREVMRAKKQKLTGTDFKVFEDLT